MLLKRKGKRKSVGSPLKFFKNRKSVSIALGVCLAVVASAYVATAKFSAAPAGSWAAVTTKTPTFTIRTFDASGKPVSGVEVKVKVTYTNKKTSGLSSAGKSDSNGIVKINRFSVCKNGNTKKLCYDKDNIITKASIWVVKNGKDVDSKRFISGSTTGDATLTLNITTPKANTTSKVSTAAKNTTSAIASGAKKVASAVTGKSNTRIMIPLDKCKLNMKTGCKGYFDAKNKAGRSFLKTASATEKTSFNNLVKQARNATNISLATSDLTQCVRMQTICRNYKTQFDELMAGKNKTIATSIRPANEAPLKKTVSRTDKEELKNCRENIKNRKKIAYDFLHKSLKKDEFNSLPGNIKYSDRVIGAVYNKSGKVKDVNACIQLSVDAKQIVNNVSEVVDAFTAANNAEQEAKIRKINTAQLVTIVAMAATLGIATAGALAPEAAAIGAASMQGTGVALTAGEVTPALPAAAAAFRALPAATAIVPL